MMKLKRKSLALMVGITCSGLLYGVNANAEQVDGFSTATASLTTINGILESGGLTATDTNLSAGDSVINQITTDVLLGKQSGVANFTAYGTAAKSANTANKSWYTAFYDYLNNTDKSEGHGLLSKISGDLNNANPTLTVVNENGATSIVISSAEQAGATLLNLIQLAQEAKDADEAKGNGESAQFNKFLSDNKNNLRVLGISKDQSGTEVLESGAASTTFMHFVNKELGSGSAPVISVRQVRENLSFLKKSKVILDGEIPSAMTTGGKTVTGQSGGNGDGGKLTSALTDEDSGVIIAAKGTKLKVKNDSVSYKGGDLGAGTHSYVYLKDSNGKDALVKLGQVAVTNSNVQGNSNTVMAKSAAVFNDDGDFVNPAEGITAYGNNNTIESNGIAVGNGNTVGENGTVIGNESEATGNNAIAFGNNAVAANKNSIALGSDSRTIRDNEVNVGMWTLNKEKQIYSQTGTRNISGVANATRNDDAVNLAQLNEVKTDTTTKINGLKQEMNSKIDVLDKKVNKGFAANAALSGLFQPYGIGKINMTAGVGGYQSESAVAVGVGYRINENVAVKGGIAAAVGNGSSTMYNASVNFEW